MVVTYGHMIGSRNFARDNPIGASLGPRSQNGRKFELLCGYPTRSLGSYGTKKYLYQGACPNGHAPGHGCF